MSKKQGKNEADTRLVMQRSVAGEHATSDVKMHEVSKFLKII
jgi:hypothetical protein